MHEKHIYVYIIVIQHNCKYEGKKYVIKKKKQKKMCGKLRTRLKRIGHILYQHLVPSVG